MIQSLYFIIEAPLREEARDIAPALSAANAGAAVSGGAQIAGEIADITISGGNLH